MSEYTQKEIEDPLTKDLVPPIITKKYMISRYIKDSGITLLIKQ